MTHNEARDDATGSKGIIVERSIVPAADNLLAEVTNASEIVVLIAAEMNDDAKLRRASHKRPWYRTPSVWWLLPITVMGAMFKASTIAPRTELFIKFACDELKPEYRIDANIVQWGSTSSDTEVDVPITFVRGNSTSGDQNMKMMLNHPDKRCAQDLAVQRAAAKLSAGIASAEGLLSCFTLGWWAQYSDRAGRTKVLGIATFTGFIAELLLFLVAFKPEALPGGYRVLILGGVLHGITGGFSAVVAAGHAYVADCSSPSSRSRVFSFWTGCVYAGAALGPSLGSLINSYSDDLLSTFYICTATNVIYGALMIFIVPESLSSEARAKAQELYEADVNLHTQTLLGSLWRLTSFVRPLGMFIPRRIAGGRASYRFRDWSLTLVGVAATAVAINMGSYHFKYQYALKTFHWSSVQLGHWLSLVGFWRALYLSVILPIILKALYAREERLSNGARNDDEKEAQVKKIDLLVVQGSLLIDLVGYILIGIVTSQTPFIGATVILAFGGGFTPSVQSLSLALASPSAHIARREARARGESITSNAKQEIGRLFGALALIHSLGAQVVGPALFGTVFGATVEFYPRTIFWLCGVLVVLALGALGAVRLDIGATTKQSNEHQPLLA